VLAVDRSIYNNDPLATALSSFRNACISRHTDVLWPRNKFLLALAQSFMRMGYISTYRINKYTICVVPTYTLIGRPVVRQLKQFYCPSNRISATVYQLRSYHYKDWPMEYVINTSQGILRHIEAIRRNIGGFIICSIQL
jgi:ribosomal protein S8